MNSNKLVRVDASKTYIFPLEVGRNVPPFTIAPARVTPVAW
jgi:hypothetical protein